MKLPYGYVLDGERIVIHEERADAVRSIFEYYLAGASLGKVVDMLFAKGILSPTGNPKWTRAAVDKLLANKKYIPIVGVNGYMDAQFEKERRCNVNYDKAGHPRRSTRYQSPSIERHSWKPTALFCTGRKKPGRPSASWTRRAGKSTPSPAISTAATVL